MTWVQETLDDETLFPTRDGEPFPPNAREILSTIFKRLLRVYAHMYSCHFECLQAIGAEAHLNTCFRHFVVFVNEYALIGRQELAPVQDVIARLMCSRSAPGDGRARTALEAAPSPVAAAACNLAQLTI